MLSDAFEPRTARRALKVSLIVGTVLAFINHGDAILEGTMTAKRWAQVGCTFVVPYIVSTYSSIAAKRERSLS